MKNIQFTLDPGVHDNQIGDKKFIEHASRRSVAASLRERQGMLDQFFIFSGEGE